MKNINGTFVGKIKMSYDSKYIHNNTDELDKDIKRTEEKIKMFKHELETVIDMCYQRHVDNFRLYETAIDILKETLREKFMEYDKKL